MWTLKSARTFELCVQDAPISVIWHPIVFALFTSALETTTVTVTVARSRC
jgi:hypothetical protein